MRTLIAATALAAFLAQPAQAAPEHYRFDPEHTNLLFLVEHLGFSHMVGRFSAVEGGFDFDQQKPENSKVDVTLKPTSIRTSSATLDEHLQGEKFFNTAKFAEARFVSTGVKTTGADTGDITGNLTLLGVTRPVTLHVHFNKADTHPMTGAFVAGFSATGSFKRSDFGMAAYIPQVGDEVGLQFEVEGINETRKTGAQKH